MNITVIVAAIIAALGCGLALLKLPQDVFQRKPMRMSMVGDEKRAHGTYVLLAFTAVVFMFGVRTLVRCLPEIEANEKNLYFPAWLLLTMIAGMFVQVLSGNYREGNPLFAIEAGRLVLPLLFSLVVFYPIWSLAAGAPRNLFVFHAAFLNGYFWESVVSGARETPIWMNWSIGLTTAKMNTYSGTLSRNW